jgi:hypothetical protein
MIVWINEAAGESPTKIKLAIREMQRAGSRKQTAAKIARNKIFSLGRFRENAKNHLFLI